MREHFLGVDSVELLSGEHGAEGPESEVPVGDAVEAGTVRGDVLDELIEEDALDGLAEGKKTHAREGVVAQLWWRGSVGEGTESFVFDVVELSGVGGWEAIGERELLHDALPAMVCGNSGNDGGGSEAKERMLKIDGVEERMCDNWKEIRK